MEEKLIEPNEKVFKDENENIDSLIETHTNQFSSFFEGSMAKNLKIKNF
jgi:hypothetical protein